MKRTAPILIALLIAPTLAHAQVGPDESACYTKVINELVAVHDEYRSVVFGSRKDKEGNFVALTGGKVDEARAGIFETKKRLSSELVEPLVEAYRVYRCRSYAVCAVLENSINQKTDDQLIDIKILGCTEQPRMLRYDSCYLAPGTTDADAGQGSEPRTALLYMSQCRSIVEQTLAAERSTLRLAMGYDAGYRSLLQFSGITDWMLQGFPTQAVKAISDMVNMLGKLYQIPCFIGQCDDPNSASLRR